MTHQDYATVKKMSTWFAVKILLKNSEQVTNDS